jgi:2-amino-4-hydroxy-6-hydroxymethyldihydropteridine diphosphokinase
LFALFRFFSQTIRASSYFNPKTISLSKVETESITTYVGLGSNLGDRACNLLLAVRGLMEASFTVCKLSAIYETAPFGLEDASEHSPYLNMVAEIHVTNISPSQMLARMLRIEYLLGRRDKNMKKPRSVDLDLLLYGDHQCDTEFLILPHPRMHERRFVLVPLAELAPHCLHPSLNKNIQEILHSIKDDSMVKRWNPTRMRN